MFDLLIARRLLSVLLPISLPGSSVQVMTCHREIIGCQEEGITQRNCRTLEVILRGKKLEAKKNTGRDLHRPPQSPAVGLHESKSDNSH